MLAQLLQTQTPLDQVLVRLAVAVALGTVLGLEREIRHKPAGLKTHMLISLAASLFTLLTFELTEAAVRIDEGVRADPVRVTEAVIPGVAFLGAGSIIQARGKIEGITTGASIWLAGAVGMACGGGFFGIAGLAMGFALVVLTLIGGLERWIKAHARTEDD
ncbi:MAG: MgtC/SapB family protein [Geminicoccaceae bacterium]